MRKSLLVVCALLLGAPFAAARGGHGFMGGGSAGGSRGFTGGRGMASVARGGYSGARNSPGSFTGISRGASGPSTRFAAASRSSTRSGFVSSSGRGARGGFGRFGEFGGFSRSLSRPTFARRASFRVASAGTSRRFSRADDGGGSGAPAWATPGAKILSEGQQPVYSDPGNGGAHSIDGGGFIAMDQGRARDVGRAPGITWGAPDRTPSAGSGGGGGGSGASANGPAFDAAF